MEHKVARICWNTRHWERPSGAVGKSRHKESYEKQYGYGHEEWLFDLDKVVEGYQYGYIQAVGTNREKYLGSTFDLSLYSINSDTRQRWWLGTIGGVEVVGAEESASVYRRYKENGWLEEMKAQLREVNANQKAFSKSATPKNLSVIKYRPENLRLLDEPLTFDYGDPAIKSDYYNLKNYIGQPTLHTSSHEFEFHPGHSRQARGSRPTYHLQGRKLNDLHETIKEKMYKQLAHMYGKGNVGTEQDAGDSCRIDVVVNDGDGFTFYEIKVGASLRFCVREAMSQLLEYRNQVGMNRVSKLVIVSIHPPTACIEEYLQSLRSHHRIPVYYEQCEV